MIVSDIVNVLITENDQLGSYVTIQLTQLMA